MQHEKAWSHGRSAVKKWAVPRERQWAVPGQGGGAVGSAQRGEASREGWQWVVSRAGRRGSVQGGGAMGSAQDREERQHPRRWGSAQDREEQGQCPGRGAAGSSPGKSGSWTPARGAGRRPSAQRPGSRGHRSAQQLKQRPRAAGPSLTQADRSLLVFRVAICLAPPEIGYDVGGNAAASKLRAHGGLPRGLGRQGSPGPECLAVACFRKERQQCCPRPAR